MSDGYRQIAVDAIDALRSQECIVESEFGVGRADENYQEESDALNKRVKALDETTAEP